MTEDSLTRKNWGTVLGEAKDEESFIAINIESKMRRHKKKENRATPLAAIV